MSAPTATKYFSAVATSGIAQVVTREQFSGVNCTAGTLRVVGASVTPHSEGLVPGTADGVIKLYCKAAMSLYGPIENRVACSGYVVIKLPGAVNVVFSITCASTWANFPLTGFYCRGSAVLQRTGSGEANWPTSQSFLAYSGSRLPMILTGVNVPELSGRDGFGDYIAAFGMQIAGTLKTPTNVLPPTTTN
jgi:hypothetical protein